MQITYTDKSQVEDYNPDLVNAQDINQIKEAVNSKADLSALQSEIDNRVNAHTILVNDITDLQSQIDNIEVGEGGEIDLSNYYTKAQANSAFISTATTIFNGDYSSLFNKPSIPSISGLASESWVNSQGFLKSYVQDFNYNSLINKPTIPSVAGLATTIYVDGEVNGLQAQIDNLAGGGEVDLQNYYTKAQANSTFIGTGSTFFSGAYADLSGKPSIPSLSGYATELFVTSRGFVTGATWAGLPDKPVIPSIVGLATEAFVTNKNYLTGVTFSQITGSISPTSITQDASHRFWTDEKEATFSSLITGLLTDKLDASAATAFISNATDVFGDKIFNIVSLSIAQYEALSTKDPNTLYFQYA